MKKLFAALAIFALVFTACPTDDGKGNDDGDGGGETTLRIRNESSTELAYVVWQGVSFFVSENADVIGSWKQGNYISLVIGVNNWSYLNSLGMVTHSDSGTWTRNGNVLTLTSENANYTAMLSDETLTLTMGGQTFTLTSNNLNVSINSGINVKKTVEDGLGYIFFKVGSNNYRTTELVTVEKNNATDFIFTNNTVVFNVNDSNTTTLNEL